MAEALPISGRPACARARIDPPTQKGGRPGEEGSPGRPIGCAKDQREIPPLGSRFVADERAGSWVHPIGSRSTQEFLYRRWLPRRVHRAPESRDAGSPHGGRARQSHCLPNRLHGHQVPTCRQPTQSYWMNLSRSLCWHWSSVLPALPARLTLAGRQLMCLWYSICQGGETAGNRVRVPEKRQVVIRSYLEEKQGTSTPVRL
jgi:hypothetical protein